MNSAKDTLMKRSFCCVMQPQYFTSTTRFSTMNDITMLRIDSFSDSQKLLAHNNHSPSNYDHNLHGLLLEKLKLVQNFHKTSCISILSLKLLATKSFQNMNSVFLEMTFRERSFTPDLIFSKNRK